MAVLWKDGCMRTVWFVEVGNAKNKTSEARSGGAAGDDSKRVGAGINGLK